MMAKIDIVQANMRQIDALSSHMSQAAVDQPDDPSETEIFQKACELSDMGFGDFDVCLTVLTAKNNDMEEAKKALSRVIFNNQKDEEGRRKR